jgi:hypothetical protein
VDFNLIKVVTCQGSIVVFVQIADLHAVGRGVDKELGVEHVAYVQTKGDACPR